MKVICAGDSLTYGYGVSHNQCWVSLLKAENSYAIINKGVNGDTSSSLLNRSHQDIIALKPSHAIVMCGTNDFLMGGSAHRTFDNLKFLYEEMANNSIKTVFLTPPPVYPSLAKEQWSSYINYANVNIKIKELGELISFFSKANAIKSINLYEIFQRLCDEYSQFYSDGIHLTAKGHLLIYNSLKALNIFD